jgi:hypothetical protein
MSSAAVKLQAKLTDPKNSMPWKKFFWEFHSMEMTRHGNFVEMNRPAVAAPAGRGGGAKSALKVSAPAGGWIAGCRKCRAIIVLAACHEPLLQ